MKVVGAKTTKIPIHKITFYFFFKSKCSFNNCVYTPNPMISACDFCCSALIKWQKKKIRLKIFESTFSIIINFMYVKNLSIIGGGNSSK